jgi:hypothetical protein
MISAPWPMPQSSLKSSSQPRFIAQSFSLDGCYDPKGKIPFPKNSFDSTPYLDLYNKLDTLPIVKAGFPTVKGTIQVSQSQLPPEVFEKHAFPATIQTTAKYFGLPSEHLASVTVEASEDFLNTFLYTVTIERYLSDYGEPF